MIYKFHRSGDSSIFIRCSDICLKEEFIDNNECVNNCPNFYEEDIKAKEKKCIESCDEYFIGKKCVKESECKFIDGNTSSKECLNSYDKYISGNKCSDIYLGPITI